MSDRLEERLRRAAQTYRRLGNHSAEGMFLEAADTITELRDDLQRANAENARLREERDCIGMASYEVGYKNGSVHYELEHCPACKNIADLQEALEENARLRSCLSDDAENARMIMGENAKLHEELEQWHRLTAGIELPEYPITEFKPKDLERENSKLRELVRKVEHYERMGCHECPYDGSCDAGTLYDEDCAMSREIEREMRELGIEVEDA